MPLQRLHDRRHRDDQGDPVVLDAPQGVTGIEPLVQDDGCPAIETRGQHDVQAADMKQGDAHQDLVAAPHVGGVNAVEGVVVDGFLGQHRALGPAGRARGIDQQKRRVGTHMGIMVVARRQGQLFVEKVPAEAGCGGPAADEGGIREIDPEPLGVIEILIVAEHRLGARIPQNVRVLRRRQAPVERQEHGPQPGRGEEQEQIFGGVGTEIGDPVAAPDAQPVLEHPGMGPDPVGEPGVGLLPPRMLEGDLVGRESGVGLDPAGEVVAHSSSSPLL